MSCHTGQDIPARGSTWSALGRSCEPPSLACKWSRLLLCALRRTRCSGQTAGAGSPNTPCARSCAASTTGR
eukprot:11597864-Heterocapsa_arctica.AAC.1